MRVNRTSRHYELLPGLPIEVAGDVPVAFQQKVERELGFYYREPGALENKPVLVVDGEAERILDSTLKLDTIDLFYSSQEAGIVLRLRQGSVLIRGLSASDRVRFSCQGDVSVRDAWHYLENIYKHICLIKRQTVFIHGCSFQLEKRHLFLSGWSGSGKTFLLLTALKRGAVLFAEDFLILSETGEVYPYVPVYFDFGYYHILELGLLGRLAITDQLKSLAVTAVDRLTVHLPSSVLRKIGDRLVRNSRYYYMNWQSVLPASKYDGKTGTALDGWWYILKNTDSGDLSSTTLSSSTATSSLVASVLHEMRRYLDMLWRAEFLGLNPGKYCAQELVQRAFTIVDRGLRHVQVSDVRLPKVLDSNAILDWLLR